MGVADIQQADLWLQDLTNQLTSTTDVLGLSGDQLNLLRTTVEVIMDSLPARSAQINPLASHVRILQKSQVLYKNVLNILIRCIMQQ